TSGRCSTVWIVVVPTPKSLAVAVRDMPSARRAATSLRKAWDGGLRVPLGRPIWRVDPYFRLGVVVGAAGEADDLEGSGDTLAETAPGVVGGIPGVALTFVTGSPAKELHERLGTGTAPEHRDEANARVSRAQFRDSLELVDLVAHGHVGGAIGELD